MILNALRHGLVGLALLSLLISPLLLPPPGVAQQSAFCGVGQAQSALALKMQSVASPELLAFLGYQPAKQKHCPLCLLTAGGVSALLLVLGWSFLARRQPRLFRRHGRVVCADLVRRAYQSRAPPQLPLFN